MNKSAIISTCEAYRYTLKRVWDETLPMLGFIMLNPSTADSEINDPTISRCIQIAKHNGFGSICVTNLYAYRSTDPYQMLKLGLQEAQGHDNEQHIVNIINSADKIIVAWGSHGSLGTLQVRECLQNVTVYCLKINKNGSPKHPLYCRVDSQFQKWEIPNTL